MHGRAPQPATKTEISLPRRRRTRLMSVVGFGIFGLGFVVSLALLVTGALFAVSGDPLRSQLAFGLLGVNLMLILVLGAFLTVRVWSVLAGRTGQAAPILHRRFVLLFSLVALAPAMLVGVFSTSLITQNIDDVFGEDVRGNFEQARSILNSYVNQELATLLPKVELVRQLANQDPDLIDNRITLTAVLQRVAIDRNIDSIYVLQRDGHVLARVEGPETPELRIPVPAAFDLLQPAQTALQTRDEIDYLMALTKLESRDDTYIYIGDYLRENAGVLSSISGIEEAELRLDRFNTNTRLLNRTFVLTYLETALLVLMAAVILGTLLANRIIQPLGRIISASDSVRSGDLSARVKVERNWGEVSDLGGAFNRMTEQLSTQRADLVREHDLAERRRLFSEAVLSGVTAGIIGLTNEGRITLANASAHTLLGTQEADLIGKPLELALPEFGSAFRKARESLAGQADDQVDVPFGQDGSDGTRTFDLRVSSYKGERADTGWVVTFDDMTRLVAAQRNSAWREVARRIAHEIKNPLTPIQLSAERLQLKFGDRDMPEKDATILARSTETILRAVGNLERMVDEFSSFARMPEPRFEATTLEPVMHEAIAEQGVAFPNVKMSHDIDTSLSVLADQRLLGQALTNLVKNAAESVERSIDEGIQRPGAGRVFAELRKSGSDIIITIEDNGTGWPEIGRDRLVEPYVTTRAGGTGLGLAIVQRIAEDHGGRLVLSQATRYKRGARAALILPSLDFTKDVT